MSSPPHAIIMSVIHRSPTRVWRKFNVNTEVKTSVREVTVITAKKVRALSLIDRSQSPTIAHLIAHDADL